MELFSCNKKHRRARFLKLSSEAVPSSKRSVEIASPTGVSRAQIRRLARLATNFDGEIAKLPPEKRKNFDNQREEARRRRAGNETSHLLDMRFG